MLLISPLPSWAANELGAVMAALTSLLERTLLADIVAAAVSRFSLCLNAMAKQRTLSEPESGSATRSKWAIADDGVGGAGSRNFTMQMLICTDRQGDGRNSVEAVKQVQNVMMQNDVCSGAEAGR
jgi:hypothetical protein